MSKDAPKPFKEIPNLDIARLHSTYERLAKQKLRLDGIYHREQAWIFWVRQGFTEADLILVINYLWAMIRKDRRRPESLKFSNLIESWDRFEEDLNMAKGWSRNATKPTTARQDVLKAVGRGEAPEKREFTTPKEIFAKGLEELRKKAGL